MSKCCLFAQDTYETWQMAVDQMNYGNHRYAISLFKRIALFGDERIQQECWLCAGDCYFALNELEQADEYYDIALEFVNNDSIKNEIHIKKSLCLTKENHFSQAKQELENVSMDHSSYFQVRQAFHLGMIEFLNFNFAGSYNSLTVLFEEICPENKNEFDALFQETKKINKRKKSKLWLSSIILPGSGQLLYKDYYNAANSAILNVSLIGLTYYIGVQYGIPDAAFTVFPWWYRYYSGGIVKARESKRGWVKDLHSKYYFELLEVCNECLEGKNI